MIKKKDTKNAISSGNWLLVGLAGFVLLCGLVLIVIAIIYASAFDWWWTVSLCAAGGSSVSFASMAIIENEPAWLLLDLILPG